MKLIIAQGNPGSAYVKTRHNAGFSLIDSYAAKNSLEFSSRPKFYSELAEMEAGDGKIILAKPTTFYNETGRAARAIVDFYKLNPQTDILVIHDDTSLPFGTLRIRDTGSDAGNNGIKSLNSHLGPDYKRLRVGISSELQERVDSSTFVLSKFSKEEQVTMNELITPQVVKLIDDFVHGTLDPSSYTV